MPFPFQTENEQIKSWDAIVIIISCDIMQDIYLQLHLFLTTFTMALPLDNQNVNVAKIKGRENICLLSYILQNRIQNDERKTLMGKMSDWLLAYGNCEESLHLQHSCHQQPFQNKIEHEIHLPIKCAWEAVCIQMAHASVHTQISMIRNIQEYAQKNEKYIWRNEPNPTETLQVMPIDIGAT